MRDIVLAATMAYLLGGIPVGRMLTRLRSGEDVWDYGNGTATFNNLLVILGAETALVKSLLDFLKGVLVGFMGIAIGVKGLSLCLLLAALLIGHLKPLGTTGKEGTGIVPGLGYLWFLWPEVGGFILAIYFGVLVITRSLRLAGDSLLPALTFSGLLAGNLWAALTVFTIVAVSLNKSPKQKPRWTITGSGGTA